MDLKVVFKREVNLTCVVDMPLMYLGTKHIDEIRQFAGCNLLIELMDGIVARVFERELVLIVDEEDARRLGICVDQGKEQIFVAEKELNQLYSLKPHTLRDDDTGEILKAWMEWELDYDKAIEFIEEKLEEDE